MANHKSALKRIRNSEVKRLRNRYQHKTTRNAMKKFVETTDKKEAEKLFSGVISMIDKLSKNNVIHNNKASNL
ncbi:30S ribosomal protein S20, partial [Flavobacteriaceae bacterium]|nr:30S ribosomal protein S20 [Flavobacteriaceae bacterium]MDA9908084.1 30S ribosomal protein S20 [Flavobacteriaceae bacterium]MDC0858164.1 30S ribosomal protein S20 [Flavobacteriaceae bacterium]